METDLTTIKNKLKNWEIPDTDELKRITKILSTAYLYRKNNIFPTENEINDEFKRREKYITLIKKKLEGEKGFYLQLESIWIDPPIDFK